ncbi:MAG: hypothetical protein E6I35_09370 [Chloroflexi bacterium]|nr:MAG: hypothetical protein E6I35_09370 [Chloroflexota bacterium]
MQNDPLFLHAAPGRLSSRNEPAAVRGEVEFGDPHPPVLAITEMFQRGDLPVEVFADSRHGGRGVFLPQPVLGHADEIRVSRRRPDVAIQQWPDHAETRLDLMPQLVAGRDVCDRAAFANVDATYALLELVSHQPPMAQQRRVARLVGVAQCLEVGHEARVVQGGGAKFELKSRAGHPLTRRLIFPP